MLFVSVGNSKRKCMSIAQLVEFLNKTQRDPRLNEILYPYANPARAKELIQQYEPNKFNAQKGQLSLDGFWGELTSCCWKLVVERGACQRHCIHSLGGTILGVTAYRTQCKLLGLLASLEGPLECKCECMWICICKWTRIWRCAVFRTRENWNCMAVRRV